MNKEGAYASDSDESDEDFCPELEKDKAAGESEDDSTSEEEEEANNEAEQRSSSKKIKTSEKSKKPVEIDAANDRRSTRLRGDLNNERNKSRLEKNELESDEEDKSHTDALWADFLSDVKPTDEKKTTASNSNGCSTLGVTKNKTKKMSAAEASEPAKCIEIFDFAGKEVCVEKTVSADSIKENKAATSKHARTMLNKRPATEVNRSGVGGSGLGSLLSQIGKKPKMSVLEKTKLDWNSFKQDEGIEEELQTFNKGRDGFLERQDFLQRTDVRQFEHEKNLRQTRKN